jgi:hypothetical protein
MRLKCVYCDKDAIQIWYGSGLIYELNEGRKRPVLYPLCEDHSLPTSFISIKKEKKNGKG